MPLLKNHLVTLSITSLSSDGSGVGRVDGQAVFVPFTATGDVVEAKIVKVCGSYAFGIVQRILTPAAQRTAPVCPIYEKCGGCCFQHITYEAELIAKERFVSDAMQRLGGLTFSGDDAQIRPTLRRILPSPAPLRYRNKAQYPLTKTEDGEILSGFFAQRSHRVIPCTDCALQPALLNAIARDACRLFTLHGLSVYDEATHKGLLRHIYLRHAITTGRVMVCFVINGRQLPHADEICDALCSSHPEISTIVLNINTKATNVITGETCTTLCGSGVLVDVMSGVPVSLSPLSFYQVNTEGANQLYAAAAALADVQPHEILLDLYCGAGTIGLSLASRCKRLIGVEIVPQAIENAKRNAAGMGFDEDRVQFLCADAGEAAQQLAREQLAPNLVILDPPRKGCDAATLEAVASMHPQRIVMISCNPATAARDVKTLRHVGYDVQAVQPVDLFPRTRHVETCVLLSHKNS